MTGDERPAVAGDVIDLERLISMANQIGDFYAPYPPERAREGMRNHLRTNWDPRIVRAAPAWSGCSVVSVRFSGCGATAPGDFGVVRATLLATDGGIVSHFVTTTRVPFPGADSM